MKYSEINSTVVISDIRNFTGLFEKFQSSASGDFLKFVESFYDAHMKVVSQVSDKRNAHIDTAGDSVITTFMGPDHYSKGYAFAILVFKELTELCKDFNMEHDAYVSFGIGVDCGHIWKVTKKLGDFKVDTYLGSVINRTARIQDSTKDYGDTNMVVSGNVYSMLVRKLHPGDKEISNIYNSKNYDRVIKEDKIRFIDLSEELMLHYVFKKILKGVSKPLPIFRFTSEFINDPILDILIQKLLK